MYPPVRFVHISDTHIGPTADYQLAGCMTLPNAERVIEAINTLVVQPDFVVHTGDIVTSPHPDAFKLAAQTFAGLRPPIYFVTGNHDTSSAIHAHLAMGLKTDLAEDRNVLSYAFQLKGHRFLTLDARGPEDIDPHGLLSAQQLDILRHEVRTGNVPLIIFIHFPAFSLDSSWFDREMLLLNGEVFHKLLVERRERIRGVFFGHVHRGMHLFKDGILYSSVASTCRQFYAWPDDEHVEFDHSHPPCFNLVSIHEGRTVVKEHML